MSQVKLSEFNYYGTFRLRKDETVGIEHLVQPLGEYAYLSRNAEYYPCILRDLEEAASEYAHLNDLLPLRGKPAFVVCDKMHELAVRVVNTIRQQNNQHLFQDGAHFDTVAQKCAQECADNLVRLIHGQTAEKTATPLSDETRVRKYSYLNRDYIEANNLKQLYMCANALPDDTTHLLTPGSGSSKLGTLVQAVRRHKGLKPLGFTQINYNRRNGRSAQGFAQSRTNLPEKVLVMDDLIFKGTTLAHIKKELTRQGHQVTSGALTASFFPDKYDPESVFMKDAWAHYIDIIPNQYAWCNDQAIIIAHLDHIRYNPRVIKSLNNLLDNALDYSGTNLQALGHTADYLSMKKAERLARQLGADLYQASAKISPAAVAYNQKIRAQVAEYDKLLS